MGVKLDNTVFVNYNNVLQELMAKFGLRTTENIQPGQPQPLVTQVAVPAINNTQQPNNVPLPPPPPPLPTAKGAPQLPVVSTQPPVAKPTLANKPITVLPSISSDELKKALRKAQDNIKLNINQHKSLERKSFWKDLANTIAATIGLLLLIALVVAILAIPFLVGLQSDGIIEITMELLLKIGAGVAGLGIFAGLLAMYGNDSNRYDQNAREQHLLYSRTKLERFEKHFNDKHFVEFVNGFDEDLRPALVQRADFHALYEKFSVLFKIKQLEQVKSNLKQEASIQLDPKVIAVLRSEQARLENELSILSHDYNVHNLGRAEYAFETAKKQLLEKIAVTPAKA